MNDQYLALLEQAKQYSVSYLDGVDQRPVYPTEEAIARLKAFEEPMPVTGTRPEQVLQMLQEYGADATTEALGGSYFGFVNGSILPVAHAASWMASTWNQNCALYVMSPVSARLEEL